MTTVCTGFSPDGYEQYGKMCIESFDTLWPKTVKLNCYIEDFVDLPRQSIRSLWLCDGVEKFIDKHKNDPAPNGRGADRDGWKPSAQRIGYNWRYDSVRFCRQLFIPEHAAMCLPDGELLAWLDGDVLTHAKVPDNFLYSLIGDADLVYLGRETYHSELGFWAVTLNKSTRAFLHDLVEEYRSGHIFSLREWHSAWVFDHVRGRHSDRLKIRNLSRNGKGHVWFETPLGLYTDHLKGKRKNEGISAERRGEERKKRQG